MHDLFLGELSWALGGGVTVATNTWWVELAPKLDVLREYGDPWCAPDPTL